MVWDEIMGSRETDLIVDPDNLVVKWNTDVLRPVVCPSLDLGILVIVNGRPQMARLTQNYLARHNVSVLQCPCCSPDNNPIEHIWDLSGRRTGKNNVVNK